MVLGGIILLASDHSVTDIKNHFSTSLVKLVKQFIGLKLSINLGSLPGFKIGIILVTLKTEGKVDVLIIQFIMWHKRGAIASPHFLTLSAPGGGHNVPDLF